jgi:PAS domain S-box-containing protein
MHTTDSPALAPDATTFLRTSGEMADRIRAFDWASTPLGSIEGWPQSLKTAAGLLVGSPIPMVMLWGPEGVMLYNDAYSVFAGGRHPRLLGSNVRDGWPEVADFNDNVMKVGLAGGTLAYRDQELTLHRHGTPEQVWMDLDYWPVPDEAGAPAGVICTVIETTERNRLQARQAALLELNDTLHDLTDAGEIAQAGASILARALGATRAGYGLIDSDAETIDIQKDHRLPDAVSLHGVVPFADYGRFFAQLRRGEIVAVDDVAADARTSHAIEAMRYLGVAATVNVPLIEQGRLAAIMYVGDGRPRRWTPAELDLMREVTVRVRTATERARASAELLESEAQFRAFSEAVPNHVWASRPDGHIYWFNTKVYAYTGVDEGALVGPDGWGKLVHADDLPGASAAWARSLETGEVYRTEFRVRRADGEWRWFEVRAEPVRDAAGAIIQWVGANMDSHDLRQQGLELERVNEILSGLLAGSKAERDQLWTLSEDMLARADYAGGLVAVNPAWTKVLGWSERELLTNPYADIISPDDLGSTSSALVVMGETGRPTRFENRILSKDGRWTPIGWTVSPEAGGTHFIAIGRDLTEDKAREQQLIQAQDALRQSQKMEAVGQLTGGIAHDFNNLLAGISGSLELLEKRISEGRLTGVDRYITAAQGAAQRAAALTQRLLAFSRRQTLDPKAIDLNRLIAGMEDLIRRSVGPTVEVEVVGAGGLWATRMDPSQLENALLNLCINSRDAMQPDGGRLTIETANKWLDNRAARERDLPPGQYVSLCVTDTGTGMPPEVIAQAFDPFFTTKPLGQGTGLGLSMIHGFVRQSGGQVRIYSELGKGTTMCLYLPRFAGEAEAVDDAPGSLSGVEGHGETVLVIDDEPTVRMLIVEVLEDAGYRALQAADGPSGLALLRSDAPIDLLITDVGLPGGMNGRQVADAARETRPGLKVLFVTGYAENAAVGNGHLDAGMEVMTKPFAMTELGERIRDMVERP